MDVTTFKQALDKTQKDYDLYMRFTLKGVRSGIVYGGEKIDVPYRIRQTSKDTYVLTLGFNESVAIPFDDYKVQKLYYNHKTKLNPTRR